LVGVWREKSISFSGASNLSPTIFFCC
jgi:hypothetical protein